MLQHRPKPSRSPEVEPGFVPSVEELKKVLGPIRDARLARATLSRPVRGASQRPSRQELESLVAKTGFDTAAVDKLVTQYQTDRRALADQQKQRALAQSSEHQASLDREIAARRRAADYFSGLLPLSRYQVIDHPFLIWPSLNV